MPVSRRRAIVLRGPARPRITARFDLRIAAAAVLVIVWAQKGFFAVDDVLFQPLIYLCAAGVMAPLAERLGLGSVLGYLLAGIIIGPLLGLVGGETETLQSFAEIGVILMLFLVGLELQPRLLWELRSRLLGLGGLQVAGSALALGALAMVLGHEWRAALAVGLILALSSTAMVLQTLSERGLLKSEGGRASVAILLFQDVFVIVILAIMPLLAGSGVEAAAHGAADAAGGHGAGESAISGLPAWAQAVATVSVVAIVILFGRFAVRPVLRTVAQTRAQETFTVVALLMVVAISWLTAMVGLSPALGAFLAGVVLADSEFRHELQSDVEPFKGILLGLFFITVGAGMDLSVMADTPGRIAVWVVGLILLKIAVLYPVARAFGLQPTDRWLVALGLAQAGEFGFVLLTFAVGAAVLPQETANILSAAIVLSMLATPGLFILYARVVRPHLMRGVDDEEPDQVTERGTAIIVGIGRFGQIVHRMLRASGFDTVVLDHSMGQVKLLRNFGVPSFYGDATRPDMLVAAGIEDAKVLVIALGNPGRALELVEFVKTHHPHVTIVARAYDRLQYYRLRAAGADYAVREMFGSSLEAARCSLEALGVLPSQAARMESSFRKHDYDTVEALFEEFRDDPDVLNNQRYIDRARAAWTTLGEVMARDGLLDDDGHVVDGIPERNDDRPDPRPPFEPETPKSPD